MATSKVVLITGANSGVGYEAVKVFLQAENPYHILCAARSIEKATAAVNRVKEECSDVKNTMEPLALDVSSDDSIQQAFEAVRAGPGRVDALINNAGTSPFPTPSDHNPSLT
nr:short-chain dehydrogenase/reductase trope [Quercus suber]